MPRTVRRRTAKKRYGKKRSLLRRGSRKVRGGDPECNPPCKYTEVCKKGLIYNSCAERAPVDGSHGM